MATKPTPSPPVNNVVALPPILMRFPDDELIIEPAHLTPREIRTIEQQTGRSLTEWLAHALGGILDLHSLAALIWIARKQRGDRGTRGMPLTYEHVLDDTGITYQLLAELEIEVLPEDYEPGGDADSPE